MNTPTIVMTEHEGYDLFRRAIAERDEQAWAVIYIRYRTLLLYWAQRAVNRYSVNESVDDIADQAFARGWMALKSERFSQFPTLASLLAYLRSCVTTTVIDLTRTMVVHGHEELDENHSAPNTPEQVVIDELGHAEVWQVVAATASTVQERTVLVESFVYDLPPRTIHGRHPDLFGDVATVYRTKRNLLDRLQRNRDIWGLMHASDPDQIVGTSNGQHAAATLAAASFRTQFAHNEGGNR